MGKKKRPGQQNATSAVGPAAVDKAKADPGMISEEYPEADALLIGDADYEQRAINRRMSELDQIRAEIAVERKEWLRSHRMTFIVIASVLILAMIFIGIKLYNDANHPLSRLNSALSKNLGSSFSFRVTAEKDGEAVMAYDGVMKTNPARQRLEIEYEADYTDYSYRNVLYTDKGETYKGNYYNGQWTVGTVTEKTDDFFDFFTDFRAGRFDSGSFLRFTELNGKYAADELAGFFGLLKSRLAADTPAAKITRQRNSDGSTDFHYEINLISIAELIRDEGASIYFRSTDYDSFVARLEANRDNLSKAECSLSYTITPSGYLSRLEITLDSAGGGFAVRCEMSDFGSAEPDIPDAFFEAVYIEREENGKP